MSDQRTPRINPVYRSLHKPLTYLDVERKLFYWVVCVGAVSVFVMFSSVIAMLVWAIGTYAFCHWVTNTDPAYLRIIGKRYAERYDAAKQQVPMVEIR